MYYPYLRGRQYELIALRELNKIKIFDSHIIPIIEPVKASSTLLSVLQDFSKNNNNIALIQNPKVGSFFAEMSANKKYSEAYNECCNKENFIKAHILNSEFQDVPQMLDMPNQKIYICNDKDAILHAVNLQDKAKIFIPDEAIFRRNIETNRVIFADRFNKKGKNAEYDNPNDEFFSDDHKHFLNEGYKGFSDYSIIGDEYIESGFAPYAVAIHMVYFDATKSLRVHHFVSDTNDDYNDTAGKFAEALKKLIDYQLLHESENQTFAYNVFKALYNNGEYPGLGTIKKLSIMHHFELISRYFLRQT